MSAFAHADLDPVNRLRTYRDLAYQSRPGAVIDETPLHVAGGVPVTLYLKGLLNRLANPGSEHNFSAAASSPSEPSSVESEVETSGSEVSGISNRSLFLDELVNWFKRHVPVCLRLPRMKYPVYVWRSFLENEGNYSGIGPNVEDGSSSDSLAPSGRPASSSEENPPSGDELEVVHEGEDLEANVYVPPVEPVVPPSVAFERYV